MRLFSVFAVLFVIAILLGFWTNRSLKSSSRELLQNVEQIAQGLENNNWERAFEQTVELEKTWDKKAKWWPVVLDHQEIDNIEFALARVKEYIVTRNDALSRGQLSELRLMIQHIPETETVTLQNIF